jgi:hypothetical protein
VTPGSDAGSTIRIVVNHLRFKEPIPASLIDAAREVARVIGEAGGECRLVKVDDSHAFLILGFPDANTEERIKSEIGGPWMREHVILCSIDHPSAVRAGWSPVSPSGAASSVVPGWRGERLPAFNY